MEVDAVDMVWALFGTAVHASKTSKQTENIVTEEDYTPRWMIGYCQVQLIARDR